MKPEKYETTKFIFKDTSLNISNKGRRDLDAVIGRGEFRKKYVIMRVNEWVTKIKLLTKNTTFYPQASYCAFTSGLRLKFNYI